MFNIFYHHPLANPQAEAMAGLNFTEEDLRANDEGYMTKRQRRRLAYYRTERTVIMALLVLGCLTLTVVVLLNLSTGRLNFPTHLRLPVFILAWGITLVIGIIFYFQQRQLTQDLAKGSVAVVEGPILLIRTNLGKGVVRYVVGIDQMSFVVRARTYYALLNNYTYRIFYAPYSRNILSVKILAEMTERS